MRPWFKKLVCRFDALPIWAGPVAGAVIASALYLVAMTHLSAPASASPGLSRSQAEGFVALSLIGFVGSGYIAWLILTGTNRARRLRKWRAL